MAPKVGRLKNGFEHWEDVGLSTSPSVCAFLWNQVYTHVFHFPTWEKFWIHIFLKKQKNHFVNYSRVSRPFANDFHCIQIFHMKPTRIIHNICAASSCCSSKPTGFASWIFPVVFTAVEHNLTSPNVWSRVIIVDTFPVIVPVHRPMSTNKDCPLLTVTAQLNG